MTDDERYELRARMAAAILRAAAQSDMPSPIDFRADTLDRIEVGYDLYTRLSIAYDDVWEEVTRVLVVNGTLLGNEMIVVFK